MVEMAAFAMGYRKKGRVRADSEISGFSKWKDEVGLSEIKKRPRQECIWRGSSGAQEGM